MTARGEVVRKERPSRSRTAAQLLSGRVGGLLGRCHADENPRWLPDGPTFARLHRVGKSIPVVLELDDPGWEPLDIVAALPERTTAYLLETPGGPADLSRRTFVAWDPGHELVLRRGWLETHGTASRPTRQRCSDPIQALRRFLLAEGAELQPQAGGFLGGLIGYIAYDFKNYLERLPDRVQNDLGTPDLRLGLVRRVLAWNHREKKLRLCVNLRCRSTQAKRDHLRARDALISFLDECERLANCRSPQPRRPANVPRVRRLQSNLTRASYDRMLSRTREHILAGDLYQANVSQRFQTPFSGSGLQLYRSLRQINPSPFAAYLRFAEHEVVSCSPERLVRLEGNLVETRPIAGTRPRGASHARDQKLEAELLASDKERAEHLMIVDMARNDIGRVCELGSVEVERFMVVERYSHVRHLVSNVVGRLHPRHDALDLLAATFPGASITGVPKVRCMQIIDELERVRRGVYTGSAGYIGLDGSLDLNILIRTFFLQDGMVYFNVGGGIVADSDPDLEYAETLAKGKALLEALSAVAEHEMRDCRARTPRRFQVEGVG